MEKAEIVELIEKLPIRKGTERKGPRVKPADAVLSRHSKQARKAKERAGRRGQGVAAVGGPSGVRRGGTGQPAWFQDLRAQNEAQRAMVAALRKIPTVNVTSAVAPGRPGHQVAARYPNLLRLVKAKRSDLLALPGVGGKTLAAIQVYMEERNVTAHWHLNHQHLKIRKDPDGD